MMALLWAQKVEDVDFPRCVLLHPVMQLGVFPYLGRNRKLTGKKNILEDVKGSLAYSKESLGYEVKDKITGVWFPVW
jgi:hypothetical protein